MLLLWRECKLENFQLQSLDIDDVDIEMEAIKIKTRSGKNNLCFLNPETSSALKRWLSVRRLFASDTQALFISLHWTSGRKEPGQRLSRRGIRNILKRYLSTK